MHFDGSKKEVSSQERTNVTDKCERGLKRKSKNRGLRPGCTNLGVGEVNKITDRKARYWEINASLGAVDSYII